MQKLSRCALLACTLALRVGVAAAGDAKPIVTVSDEKTRVVARYGIADDVERQSQLAVKELSRLLKKYPSAKTWAVAYNTAPKLWRVLEYDIERRQLIEVALTNGSKGRTAGNDFYPAHIHNAAQQSLDIEELWKMNKPDKPTK